MVCFSIFEDDTLFSIRDDTDTLFSTVLSDIEDVSFDVNLI